MFSSAKKTMALTAALVALAPMTAFAAPHHGNRDNNYSDNNGYNSNYDSNRNNNNNGYNNYSDNNNNGYQSQQDNRQQNKNTWRDLGVAGAAVAAFGLLNHNSTATLLGAAGAAYSANRYEQDRHSQSQQQNNWRYNRRRF